MNNGLFVDNGLFDSDKVAAMINELRDYANSKAIENWVDNHPKCNRDSRALQNIAEARKALLLACGKLDDALFYNDMADAIYTDLRK